MNIIDIVIIILLVMSNLNGIRQGLIKALTGLIGWFLALLLAIRFSPKVQPLMVQYTTDPMMQKIAAFASIIVVVIILAWFAGQLLHKMLEKIKLSWLNRLAGGGFGLAKSVIIILVLMHGLAPWFSHAKIWQNSKMVDLLMPYSAMTTAYTQEVVRQTTQQMDEENLIKSSEEQNESAEASSSKSQTNNPFF